MESWSEMHDRHIREMYDLGRKHGLVMGALGTVQWIFVLATAAIVIHACAIAPTGQRYLHPLAASLAGPVGCAAAQAACVGTESQACAQLATAGCSALRDVLVAVATPPDAPAEIVLCEDVSEDLEAGDVETPDAVWWHGGRPWACDVVEVSE